MISTPALNLPFAQQYEKCTKLRFVDGVKLERATEAKTQPVRTAPDRENERLPGYPTVSLVEPDLTCFLHGELCTPNLDRLRSVMWLVAKQDSAHISSLSHQMVRGRQIIITEKPELHLVWYYDRVFVKPMPKCMLSHAFWLYLKFSNREEGTISRERQEVALAARGFLRSYHWLVQHKSDFRIAQEHHLVPKNIRYAEFLAITKACKSSTTEEDVNPRYHFGELRLTRLNLWTKIILHRLALLRVQGQYAAIVAQYYGPILFVIGMLSIMLSAAQVGLALQPRFLSRTLSTGFQEVSKGLAIASLLIVAIVILFLVSLVLVLLLRELIFALKAILRRRWQDLRRHNTPQHQ